MFLINIPQLTSLLIALEGTDQSGKKTQAAMLATALCRARLSTKLFSFPDYATHTGRTIRSVLTIRKKVPVQAIHCLMSANRWELFPKIEAAIEANSVVIMNRYYHSNIAYGIVNGLGRRWLESLDAGLPRSDLVILLDSQHSESVRRKSRNRDKFERDADFLNRVSKEYRRMARRGRWGIVNATQDRRDVHNDIMKIISRRLLL